MFQLARGEKLDVPFGHSTHCCELVPIAFFHRGFLTTREQSMLLDNTLCVMRTIVCYIKDQDLDQGMAKFGDVETGRP